MNSFDWLLPESCFDDELKSLAGDEGASAAKQVLHIGSGTSMLSFHLRQVLPSESTIRNLDFSREAVEWGKSKEVGDGDGQGCESSALEDGVVTSIAALAAIASRIL